MRPHPIVLVFLVTLAADCLIVWLALDYFTTIPLS